MLRILLMLSLYFAVPHYIAAASLTGKVTDEEQLPVEFVAIGLYQSSDSSLIKGTLSEEQGLFTISEIVPGSYYISISYLGYKRLIVDVIVEAGNTIKDLGDLILEPDVQEVATTIVTGKKSLIVQEADKTVINVANTILAEGNNALELLEKSPGLGFDADGNIQLKGRTGVLVMINGKRSYLSGEELNNFLKSTPSNSIQKLEIITNPSARYDASGSSGIINIVLKKNELTGTNGSIYTNYGRGRKNRAGAGLSLNYRNRSFNIFGSYDFWYRGEEEYRDNLRNFFDSRESVFPSRTSHQYSVTNEPLTTNNFKLGADYYINEHNIIGAVAYGNIGTYINRNQTSNILTDFNNILLLDAFTTNNNKETWNSIISNINYAHYFKKEGRELTVDFDHSLNDYRSSQNMKTLYRGGTEAGELPSFDRRGNIPSKTSVYAPKADYKHVFNKTMHFEAGWKSSIVSVDNNLKYDTLQNNNWVYDATTSNHFKYKEFIHAAYFSFFKEWKGISIQAGLRGEHTQTTGTQVTTDSTVKRSYFQLFPSAFINKSIGEDNQLRLSYSRRIERPDYGDLNPFRVYTDPYLYFEGNPFLQPELSHSLEFTYTWKSALSTSLVFSYTSDVVNWIIGTIDSSEITFQSPQNLSSQVYLGLNVSYSKEFFPWWSHTSFANVYWNKYKDEANQYDFENNMVSFEYNTQNSFKFGKGFSAELGGFYRSKSIYGVFITKPMFAVSAGVQKSFSDKKATLKIALSDIFRTHNRFSYGTYDNLQTSRDLKYDNRVLTVSFSYRFGKDNLKTRSREGGNDDIQNRVRGGS